MDKFVLIALIVVTAVLFVWTIYVTIIFSSNKLYCKHYLKKDWDMWEKVCKELYSARFVGHYEFKENPSLECYDFYIHDIGIGKPVRVIYWTTQKIVSVHEFGGTECIR